MARAIMVADDVYKALTEKKGEKSYSEVIRNMLGEERKTIRGLLKHAGKLANDPEEEEWLRRIKEARKSWTRRYA
ncbi:MAG: antitoxin VapB family protein [Candidatus Woesearchaeota archaeon]